MENRSLTILFSDMKGFTSRTSHQSRTATVEMLKRHRELLLPIIQARGGKLIKTIGDAFLVTFESPTDAVLVGVALQETLRRHNATTPEAERIEVRIAVNTGEVILEDGDVYGEPVNIASRIQALAEPNEIYFTEATYLSMNKSEVPSAEIGYRILKGIPQRIKLYRVLREGESPPPRRSELAMPALSSESAAAGRSRLVRIAGGLVVVGAVVAVGLGSRIRGTGAPQESTAGSAALPEPSSSGPVGKAVRAEPQLVIAAHEEQLAEFGRELAEAEAHLHVWQKELAHARPRAVELRDAFARVLAELPTIEQQQTERLAALISQATGSGQTDVAENLDAARAEFAQGLGEWKLRLTMRAPAHEDWQRRLDAQAAHVENWGRIVERLRLSLAALSERLAPAGQPDGESSLERLAGEIGAFESELDGFAEELAELRETLDELSPSLDESHEELKAWERFLEQSKRPLYGT